MKLLIVLLLLSLNSFGQYPDPLPSSGTLTMGQIRDWMIDAGELSSVTTVSLQELVDASHLADKTAPYSISDFYGYEVEGVNSAPLLFNVVNNFPGVRDPWPHYAAGFIYLNSGLTIYWAGNIVVGTTVYSDEDLTTPMPSTYGRSLVIDDNGINKWAFVPDPSDIDYAGPGVITEIGLVSDLTTFAFNVGVMKFDAAVPSCTSPVSLNVWAISSNKLTESLPELLYTNTTLYQNSSFSPPTANGYYTINSVWYRVFSVAFGGTVQEAGTCGP